jgi:hypothetical protein
VALVLTLVSQRLDAKTLPFFVTGKASAADGFSVAVGVPSPFTASGWSFPVGFYDGEDGLAITQSFDAANGMGTFLGTFTFVNARNGDRLVMTFGDPDNGAEEIGTFMAIPDGDDLFRVLFIAEFNPIVGQSTGRFSNVIGGSLLMYALTEPIPLEFDGLGFSVPFEFAWVGDGYLEFGGRCNDGDSDD